MSRCMGDIECIGNLNAEIQDLLQGKRLAMNVLPKRFAIDEFHGDEWPVILLANVIDSADTGMIECRSGMGLAAKTFQRLRVLHHVVGKKFQGDRAFKTRVLCFVDHTHSASTEFFYDAEVRDGLVNHR